MPADLSFPSRRRPMLATLMACALSACLALPAGAQEAASRAQVYHGATLIDGTGAPPRQGMSIVVEDGLITAVVEDADAPAGERIDSRGLYVLPGLVDTHVHVATPPNNRRAQALLRRQLYSGVTSVRGMADDLRAVGELARQARVGEIASPDIHYAALMAGPGFFDDPRTIAVTRGGVPGQVPWMQAIDEDTDLPLAVAMARGTSASGIKIYADLPAERVAAITAEAGRQGIPVWAHAAVFPAMPGDVVRAGVDVVSHVCPLAYEVSTRQPATYAEPTPVDEAAFRLGIPDALVAMLDAMAARGIVLDATHRVYVEHARQYARDGKGKAPRCSEALTYQLGRAAYARGVQISAGTDGDTAWDAAYPSLHEELEILAGPIGMSPSEVIVAATRTAAKVLGQSDRIGTIEAGKVANLVFVSADPTTDIGALRSVVLTVKRGERYPRAEYVPLTEDELRYVPVR